MNLIEENFKNAESMYEEFPFLRNVPVHVSEELFKFKNQGFYDPVKNEVVLVASNLEDGFILVHELEHALSAYYTAIARVQKESLPDEFFRIVCGKKQLISMEMRFCIESGHSKKEAPSKYGRKNNDEFGAEMMRDYYENGENASPVSKEFFEFVKRVL